MGRRKQCCCNESVTDSVCCCGVALTVDDRAWERPDTIWTFDGQTFTGSDALTDYIEGQGGTVNYELITTNTGTLTICLPEFPDTTITWLYAGTITGTREFEVGDCETVCSLKARLDALEPAPVITCTPFCPVVVGELEGFDSPLNLNQANQTAVEWGGWQSQDDAIVEVSNTSATIVGSDVCAAHVTASVLMQNVDGGATGNAQRAHPEVWILRNGVKWAAALHTYMRDVNGHDGTSANADRWDMNPQGAVYSLAVQRDSIATDASGQAATGTVEPVMGDLETISYLQVAAHRRFDLCAVAGGEGGESDPTLPPADGKVVSDNFQDGNGNAPFNLQVRNTTGNSANWQALVSGVPYATIPGLVAGNYTLATTDNGDGTYDHLFTGTTPLGGFQNIIITGGLPVPAGTGGGLTLYCEAT